MLCIKTAERIIEILSWSDWPIILVFRHQGLLSKSDGFAPNKGAEYKGVAIFDQYEAISRKRFLSVTLSDPELQFQGHSIV